MNNERALTESKMSERAFMGEWKGKKEDFINQLEDLIQDIKENRYFQNNSIIRDNSFNGADIQEITLNFTIWGKIEQ